MGCSGTVQRLALLGFVSVFVLVARGGVVLGQQQCEVNELDSFSRGALYDDFGWSVAISGDVAVVGAIWNDHAGTSSGKAYVYRFNGSGWDHEQDLTASDATAYHKFGCSVSVSGDYIVVGAYGYGGLSGEIGAAYVFHYSGSSWTQQIKLPNPEGGYDRFGRSVSISGNYIVIGSPWDSWEQGSAFVYERSGSSWSKTAKLTAADAGYNDLFGYSVAISGDTIVVGAPYDDLDDAGDDEDGSAYVFCRSGSNWTQEAKLRSDEVVTVESEFGISVAICDDTVVVGAPQHSSGCEEGRVYVFEKPVGGWLGDMTPTCELHRSASTCGDQVGKSVSISGDIVVAGVWGDDVNGYNSGSACVFMKPAGGWLSSMSHTALLLASDGASGHRLGYSVGVSGSTAVVGAHRADDGRVYAFHGLGDCNANDTLDICDVENGTSQDNIPSGGDGIPDECQSGDCDFDGDVDLQDFFAFQACYTGPNGGPVGTECECADFDDDGDVDLQDFLGFQVAYSGPGG